jgi:V8-like Glu-specific endopeptidase
MGGQSGSPVLIEHPEKGMIAIAIHKSSSSKNKNIAKVLTSETVGTIYKWS